jgi:branched-chain amino acid transport system ATP-binding protein
VSPLLEVEEVHAGYGDLVALQGISVAVEEGAALAVIGANGAGKSTLLKVINGLVAPRSGSVRFAGRALGGTPPFRRVADGITLVPEGRRLFPSLSVRENLLIGGYQRRPGPWTVERVLELFPMLTEHLQRSAAKLSGGEQQAVAIGRGLLANPRLLMLDEVSLGLAPIVVKQLYSELPRIRENGTTLLLVEQDVAQARAAADELICLLTGRVSLQGRPADLSDDAVRRAYFGIGR